MSNIVLSDCGADVLGRHIFSCFSRAAEAAFCVPTWRQAERPDAERRRGRRRTPPSPAALRRGRIAERDCRHGGLSWSRAAQDECCQCGNVASTSSQSQSLNQQPMKRWTLSAYHWPLIDARFDAWCRFDIILHNNESKGAVYRRTSGHLGESSLRALAPWRRNTHLQLEVT